MAWAQSVKEMNQIIRKLRNSGYTVEFHEGDRRQDYLTVSREGRSLLSTEVLFMARRCVNTRTSTTKIRLAANKGKGTIVLRIAP